jgi:hypothetical protein
VLAFGSMINGIQSLQIVVRRPYTWGVKDQKLAVRISKQEKQELAVVAAAEGRSGSAIVRALVAAYLRARTENEEVDRVR